MISLIYGIWNKKQQTKGKLIQTTARWLPGGKGWEEDKEGTGVKYMVSEENETSGVRIQLSIQMSYYNVVLLKFMLLTNVTTINLIK